MQDNRNTNVHPQFNCNGTVCIDTKRIFDSCRDRDCFEDVRVFLTQTGEAVLANSTNVRTRAAHLLCAYVGVEAVAFNPGFYQVVIRYYIEVDFEACLAVGKSQCFKGLAAVEKDVVLYGGEGRAISFSSDPEAGYCSPCSINNSSTNDPIAIVETVEPVVLSTKVNDCSCPCSCTDYPDIPESVRDLLGEELISGVNSPRIYVCLGIFSVIRMVRPAQLLVQATDYSVPDKECTPASNADDPCALFQTMAFPVSQFRGMDTQCPPQNRGGGCGCSGK